MTTKMFDMREEIPNSTSESTGYTQTINPQHQEITVIITMNSDGSLSDHDYEGC